MTPREHPIANFDPVARPYRWMEYLTFGRSLQRCRTHFLAQLTTRRRALVLGDGDGRFLARLLAANPELHADAVDTSAAMLRLLTRRAHAATPSAATRLRTHPDSALNFAPTQTYDLIVTHFFLDCLTQSEVGTLARRLARASCRPNTFWLVSDFCIPKGPMHWPSRALVRALYLAFRILTGLRTRELPNHAAALTAAGFTLTAQHQSLAGLLTSQLWESSSPEAQAETHKPDAAFPQGKQHARPARFPVTGELLYTPAMQLPPQKPKPPYPPDPVPDPEPASPSLPEPDPGVFHHNPGPPRPDDPSACDSSGK